MQHSLPDRLAQLINPHQRKILAIVGSGGKTTLLWHLAQAERERRVLVTAASKLFYPPESAFDHYLSDLDAFAMTRAGQGVSLGAVPANPGLCADSFFSREQGDTGKERKLLPLSARSMGRVAPLFDRILLECDGSRRRPLKGWAAHEPPVPAWAEVTVGVLPLWCVGRRLSDRLVHRPELFCALTGAGMGEIFTPQHVAELVCGSGGMFKKAAGERVVFFSQIDRMEEEEALRTAGTVAEAIRARLRACPSTFEDAPAPRLVAGSAQSGAGFAV